MKNYFNAKIEYLSQDEKGNVKKKREVYLIDAMTFTEAEGRLQEALESEISEYELLTLSRVKYSDVIVVDGSYFAIKIHFKTEEEGKAKNISETYLIKADNTFNADVLVKSLLEGCVLDWEIKSIKETNILTLIE